MNQQAGSRKKFPVRAVAGGVMAMFLAFGVGRFAYTPILPLMQDQVGLPVDLAGYLASMMYLGYLTGSVAVTKTLSRVRALTILRCGLIVLVLACGAMTAGDSFGSWALVMFWIGVSSAMIFLATLALLLGVFLDYGAGWLTALLYTGIGSGIVLIGLAVPEIGKISGWRGGWTFVALSALAGGMVCHLLLQPYGRHRPKGPSEEAAWPLPGAKRSAVFLVAAYVLHGFAYTIGGTFMVSMLAKFPGLQGQAHLAWILVGAMVIPSCIFWPIVSSRLGEVRIVTLLLVLLALSNLIVLFWRSPTGVLLAATLFGTSFLTIPGLVLGRLGKLAGSEKVEITGLATILFGIAMVIGPSTGGYIAKLTGSFDCSLALAVVALLLAAVISTRANRRPRGGLAEAVIACDATT